MGRIGELDLPDRLAPYAPVWVTQLAFALLCVAAAMLLRMAIDLFAPGAGPFALGYPAVLVATLFARWPAGLVCGLISLTHTWYFILPPANSLKLDHPQDVPRLAVLALAYILMILIADLFRRAVRRAKEERDREIAERDLFLEEFDHRVKNNFTLVTAMLDLQRRRAASSETAEALGTALARVQSIARAHRHLYRGGTSSGELDMAAYLEELCTALSEALFLQGAIVLDCTSDPITLPRDRAVSIGLIVNELVTNAAKHAFTDRDSGRISVRFEAVTAGGWKLTVADNGRGTSPELLAKGREGGLGQRLTESFARQAGGVLRAESGPEGTRITVELAE